MHVSMCVCVGGVNGCGVCVHGVRVYVGVCNTCVLYAYRYSVTTSACTTETNTIHAEHLKHTKVYSLTCQFTADVHHQRGRLPIMCAEEFQKSYKSTSGCGRRHMGGGVQENGCHNQIHSFF